jgi:hypothetical protein
LTLTNEDGLQVLDLDYGNRRRFCHATVSLPGDPGIKVRVGELAGHLVEVTEYEPGRFDFAFPNYPHWHGCDRCVKNLAVQ